MSTENIYFVMYVHHRTCTLCFIILNHTDVETTLIHSVRQTKTDSVLHLPQVNVARNAQPTRRMVRWWA